MFLRMLPVLLLTLVNTMGFSLLIPVLPFMLRSWNMPEWTFGAILSSYSLCQFWAAPLFGQLSDQYGRRRLLIWSQTGTLLAWIGLILLWIAESQFQTAVFWLVFFLGFCRFIDGITGGNNSVTQAYMSDVTTKEQKAIYFGYLSATMGLGLIVGPAIGAYTMSSSLGYMGTGLFGSILSAITLLSIIFALPESVKVFAKKEPLDLLKPFRLGTAIACLGNNITLRSVLIVQIFLSAAMGAYTSIMVFYLIDQFKLSIAEIGNFLFFVGGFAIFNQTVMVKPLTKLLGSMKAIQLGLLLMAIALASLPFLSVLWLMICLYYFCNLGFSIAQPTIRAVASNLSADTEQGKILGLLESISSLMFGIMPFLATIIYGYIGSLSFLIWAGFSAAGLKYLTITCSRVLKKKALFVVQPHHDELPRSL